MSTTSFTSSGRYKLDSHRSWEVKMMPSEKKVIAGHMLPTFRGALAKFGFAGKRRRITIETYRPHQPEESAEPEANLAGRSLKNLMSQKGYSEATVLGEEDNVIFRIFKAKPTSATVPKNVEDGEWDIESIADISSDADNDSKDSRWHEQFRIRLFDINILSTRERSCRLKLGVGSGTKIRTLTFDSEADKESFLNVARAAEERKKERADRLAAEFKESNPSFFTKIEEKEEADDETDDSEDKLLSSKKLENDEMDTSTSDKVKSEISESIHEEDDDRFAIRPSTAMQRLRRSTFLRSNTFKWGSVGRVSKKPKLELGTLSEEDGDTIDLLIEIVSACNLPAADKYKSDPYVRIFDGHNIVHKTKHILKTLNPVWTLSQNCIFLYRQRVDAFFETDELVFEICDWDAIGADTTLGTVKVSKQLMLKGRGDRKEFKIILNSEMTVSNRDPSLLALRFRQATDYDVKFIQAYAKKGRSKAVFANEAVIPIKVHREVKILQRLKKDSHGSTKYLVKPGPDPKRLDSTKWMNYYEIESEVMEPSDAWIEAGTGTLGKVYCEVLHCDDLPNLDFSITGRDKTDPFVCLVFEDAIAHTDVLNDLLSPRWMPWTQRAFVFNISHPNSQLSIGVFDFDHADSNPDVVGRATCNITNFHPGTIYTVKYNLRSAFNLEKKARGTITLRIRVEWENNNPRKALLSGYSLNREPQFLSVAKKQYFKTVSCTLSHEPSPFKLSLNTMSAYINELWTYWDFSYINEYFWSVILWKFHFKIRLHLLILKERTIVLPLRSMLAFAWGVALSRNFELFPSFLVFLVAWVLIATLDGQIHRPSPWERPRGLVDFLGVLLFNKTSRYPRITEFDDRDKITEFETLEKAVEKSNEEVLNAYYEESDNFNETNLGVADLSIATQKSGVSDILMAPFVSSLLPVQLWLHWFCRIFRITKGIVLWRDSYTAFWLVTMSITISFVFAFLPWSFILKSLLEIFVWVFLGPWMKLVDVFYFKYKSRYEKTVDEIEADLQDELQKLSNQWSGFSKDRKIMFEKAKKDKAFKEYMFGGFVIPVPLGKEEEFEYDDPVLGSTAEPADSEYGKRFCDINIVKRKHGQQLLGNNIIPARKKDRLRSAKNVGTKSNSKKNSVDDNLDNSIVSDR